MEVLNIKFKSNENNDELKIIEYFVSESVKQKYNNVKSDNILNIKVKIYTILISRVSDSFMIKYARYISCEHADSTKTLQDARDNTIGDISTNLQNTQVTKTGGLPLSLDIVLKKLVLCVINLDFAKLSHDDYISFDKTVFKVNGLNLGES